MRETADNWAQSRRCGFCSSPVHVDSDSCWSCKKILTAADKFEWPDPGPGKCFKHAMKVEQRKWRVKSGGPSAAAEDVVQAEPAHRLGQADGYVYLLRSGKHWKIGKTNDPERRIREIKLQLPDAAERVHAIATNDMDWLERHWHRHFSNSRRNGEWFELNEKEISDFCECSKITVERRTSATDANPNA